MRCHGNGPDHCCTINGETCPKLEVFGTESDRRWVCGLFRELGNWDKVHASDVWLALPVAGWFAEHHPGRGCGDWPQGIPDVMALGIGLCCYEAAAD